MANYYVKHNGNCDLSRMSDPHGEFVGKNVLIERITLDELCSKFNNKTADECNEILAFCRKRLFDYRIRRPHPHLDDKV